MPEVFVSYRHVEPDASIAAELEQCLAAHGVSVFRDTQIRVGDEWPASIENNLKGSRTLVVLLSQASADSANVRDEVRRAHKLGLGILPVRIDFAGELPYSISPLLSDKQTLSWSRGRTGAICDEILAAVKSAGTQREAAAGGMAELEPETGTVSLDSPYYVRREVDTRIESLLQGRGATILLRGPRQVGKSSLLVRAEARARSEGLKVSRIDFQLVDDEHRQTLKTLLKHMAYVMASDFNTEVQPDQVWDDRLGSKKSLTRFLERAVLKESGSRFMLCLDEVDGAFSARYCDDFFSMLRFWHNERATSGLWKQLHLVITHSTDPSLWITDLNLSPFNVGERHWLSDFTPQEVRDLSDRYKVCANLEELMDLVSGHPYLVRRALYTIKMSSCSVQDLKTDAAKDSGPFRDHLRLLLRTLYQSDEMRDAYRQILDRGCCDSERAFQRLQGAGLVKGESRSAASARCALYHSYYKQHL